MRATMGVTCPACLESFNVSLSIPGDVTCRMCGHRWNVDHAPESPGARQAELVYPVRVEGTAIAHLATAVLDEAGAGYRAICPAGPLITKPLQLIPADASIVWCGACKAWAAAVGVELPGATTLADQPGGGSADPPADG